MGKQVLIQNKLEELINFVKVFIPPKIAQNTQYKCVLNVLIQLIFQ